MSEEKKGLARLQLKRQGLAVRDPFAATDDELRALSEEHGSQALDLARVRVPLDLLELLPRETAELHGLLPIRLSGDALLVAMAQPRNRKVIDELSFVTGKRVVAYVAPLVDLTAVISEAYVAWRRGEHYYDGPRYVAKPASGDQQQESSAAVFTQRVRAGAPDLPPEVPEPAPPLVSSAATPKISELSEQAPAQQASLPVAQIEIPDLEWGDASARHLAAKAPRASERSNELGFDDVDDSDLGSGLSLAGEESRTQAESPPYLAGAEVPVESAVNAGPTATGDPKAPHVLVVEDDAEIQRLVRRLLEAEGYRVSVAADGGSGLDALKAAAPDILVLDANLPKVHGFEIVRRVRSSRRFASLPIIILTAAHLGWRYAEDLRESSGVRHYLEKPFERRELIAAVNECLGSSAASPSISPAAARFLQEGISAYQQGDLDLAQGHFEKGIRADPLAYQVYYQLGLLYGKRGKAFEAIGSLERVIRLRPRYFAGIKNLALLYQKAGFRNKSTEMWQRALGAAPDENAKESIRQHLSRLI